MVVADQTPLILGVPLSLWFTRKHTTVAFGLAFFLIGVLLHQGAPTPITSQTKVQLEGTVVQVPRVYNDAYQVTAIESDTNLYKVEMGTADNLDLGDRVRLSGTLRPFKEVEEEFWRAQGGRGVLKANSAVILAHGPLIYRWGGAWRRSFTSFCETHFDPVVASTVDALTFNVDWFLDDELREDLRRTGTLHIISASGFHVVMMFAAIGFVLIRLPLPRWVQILVIALVLLVYAGAAGLRPPVVRAVLMALLGASAYLFKRETDWPSALAATALVYLVCSPRAIYDLGFQLSYVTVFAISIGMGDYRPSLREGFIARRFDDLKQGFKVSLIATVGSAPLVAYHFGTVSLVGPVANVLIALVVAIIIVVALSFHALSFGLPEPFLFLGDMIVGLGVSYLHAVVRLLGSFRYSAIEIVGFNGYWLIPVYAGLLATWRSKPRPPESSYLADSAPWRT